ncbi:MAG: discoidin domain-containing protein, partial [Bacteroides sp.]|nr:discoidin domain-containing protein [Bacteroides sp.]
LKNGAAHFRQMGKGVIYIIMEYKNEKVIPISDPFILNNQGEINFLTPDTTSLREIVVRRKFPKAHHTAHMESRILGGRVEATNDSALTEWETFYEIEDDEYPDLIPVNTNKKYRYWRFHGRKWAFLNIAEFQLFQKGNDERLTGEIIASQGVYNNDPTYDYTKAFDGDWLTNYHAANNNLDSWIGLDLGIPVEVQSVRCVPRSDDNGIYTGDSYELVYWGAGKWNSLGVQVTRERFLVFKDVPENALLLLKNHTRGVKERIFTYENSTQKWW